MNNVRITPCSRDATTPTLPWRGVCSKRLIWILLRTLRGKLVRQLKLLSQIQQGKRHHSMQQTINCDGGDFWSSSLSNCPSNNNSAKCFLASFFWMVKTYHTIADLPSFQSTSASNIVFIINLDKMWPGENLDVVVRNLKISCKEGV